MRVDSHHHLWRYNTEDFDWIDDSMRTLRRDFLPQDLQSKLQDVHVKATVAVQARQTLEETRWLLDCAATTPTIRGVVGWAPILARDFAHVLEELVRNPLLKGLRHVVQSEPEGFLDRPHFNMGIELLGRTSLVYDVLIFAHQLREATRFADRHPEQLFVLDHIAKPNIKGDGYHAWASAFRELARRDNVVCKLSGIVTEADWSNWSLDSIRPYLDIALEAFGSKRLMVGSDWPVITVACSYSRWWETLADWMAPLSAQERASIEGEVAMRVYHLTSSPDQKSHQ